MCNFIGDINRLEEKTVELMQLPGEENHFIRLERIQVNQPAAEGVTQVEGVVTGYEYYGLYIKYYINVGTQTLKVIEKNDGVNIYEAGEKVRVGIGRDDLMSDPAAESKEAG